MDWKQRALYQLMSDISEDCYCAGWMSGNEYTLWTMVANQDADRRYGLGEVELQQIEELRAISTEVGGWIRWRDDDDDKSLPPSEWGPVFVPMEQWLPMYERRMTEYEKLREEMSARSKVPASGAGEG